MEHGKAYEKPTMTYYGTVQELTLGNGTTVTADATQCTGFGLSGFQSSTPSLLTCKTSG